jgi:uncharacterized protein
LQMYLPGKILQCGSGRNSDFPLLKGKNPVNETLIYLCRQYSCQTPVISIDGLVEQIKQKI